jgi:hypothetical protein
MKWRRSWMLKRKNTYSLKNTIINLEIKLMKTKISSWMRCLKRMREPLSWLENWEKWRKRTKIWLFRYKTTSQSSHSKGIWVHSKLKKMFIIEQSVIVQLEPKEAFSSNNKASCSHLQFHQLINQIASITMFRFHNLQD